MRLVTLNFLCQTEDDGDSIGNTGLTLCLYRKNAAVVALAGSLIIAGMIAALLPAQCDLRPTVAQQQSYSPQINDAK